MRRRTTDAELHGDRAHGHPGGNQFTHLRAIYDEPRAAEVLRLPRRRSFEISAVARSDRHTRSCFAIVARINNTACRDGFCLLNHAGETRQANDHHDGHEAEYDSSGDEEISLA